MAVIISIDAGTTGVRTFALNENGVQVGLAYKEFTQHYPFPGWVEHDPTEIWVAVQDTISELAKTLSDPIACIGITNQRETAVVWNRSSGLPLAPAIVWQDRRTTKRCTELEQQGHLGLVRNATGLVLDPYFSATKFEWFLESGGVQPSADLAFGTIDSWLIWHLTGGSVHATDPSNASRTMLFDISRNRWSDQLCELFKIPQSTLPDVLPSSGRLGVTVNSTAFGPGIPISGVAGDQQSALFGQACLEPGMTKNTYGTGSFVLMNVGEVCPKPIDGLLNTIAWDLGDGPIFALEGAIFATGAAIQWLRDGLQIIKQASDISSLAESADSNTEVFFVPAFAGLGSPWWDPTARGTLLGLTSGTSRAEIALATLQSIALQTRDVIDAMTTSANYEIKALRVDGGASVSNLLLQIQADQLSVPVQRSGVTEATALGAAMLAGLAEGVWTSVSEVQDAWTLDQEFLPQQPQAEAAELHEKWGMAVARSRAWASR